MKDNASKRIIVVLGMARSGTSAITRGLQALGVELNGNLAIPRQPWNPRGAWEDYDIAYKINRGVMQAIQLNWSTFPDSQIWHDKKLTAVRQYARNVLQDRFQQTDCWAFKDPRTAKVVPFWQTVFADMNLKAAYVIALRHPLLSALSYQRVSGSEIGTGLFFWLMHLIPAIEATHTQSCITVSYDAMLQQPRHELQRLQTYLTLPTPDEKAVDDYVNDFLDTKFQHFVSEQVSDYPIIFPLCERVYHLLLKTSHDTLSFDSETFKSEWESIRLDLQKTLPLLQYIEKLLQEKNIYEKTLRTIKKSLPWRFISPLRKIDDFLRARRRIKRGSFVIL